MRFNEGIMLCRPEFGPILREYMGDVSSRGSCGFDLDYLWHNNKPSAIETVVNILPHICNSGTSEKLWRQRLASFAGFARKSLAVSPHHIIGVIKLIYYILP
jgi:hypothetical protein